ncbi:FxDxF family PEP-CTERM protein [Rhodoferax sp.]|uniref:FxDxF family PEP-CTERM protein n=1 Tax=Rhodoferax sp. TaxID=50421 RepID=UPI00262DD378|nr:FxDxF family PEP-CTERM protein [Rhodoferax sp.]MDD4943836.1 FxDxF family PEP-CTERM protein [Rhodoferax sp.]MDD5479759.1 FxDxF family PEP-CTERM protein [Rhodoferax sp.]
MFSISKILAASLLAIGSLSAHAVTENNYTSNDLVLDPSGWLKGTFDNGIGYDIYSSHTKSVVGDAGDGYKFSDFYTFNLTDPLAGYASLVSNWKITSWSAVLNGVHLNLTPGSYAGTLSGAASFYTGMNTLVITGVTAGPGGPQWGNGTGTYNMSLGGSAVAAVPEPETFAMLLAGLGLVGFATRRRERKVASQS